MAKIKTIYSCTECGATSPKWQGQCPGCNEWNTLVETVAEKAPTNSRFESLAPTARLQNLSEIEAREVDRIATGVGEFDRALGGGLVNGAVVLIGGDPGIGKSTLLLQRRGVRRTGGLARPSPRPRYPPSAIDGRDQSRTHSGYAAG